MNDFTQFTTGGFTSTLLNELQALEYCLSIWGETADQTELSGKINGHAYTTHWGVSVFRIPTLVVVYSRV